MTDIKEKIKKLLALSGSPNEGEAKAALLKARQLMAKHKLSEKDLEHLGDQKVKHVTTDCSYTTLKNAWACTLGITIAEHYCCHSFGSRTRGCKTNYVGFVGLEDDVEVCERVFRYAYNFVVSEAERETKRFKKIWTGTQLRQARESYGFGFAYGVQEAFNKQDKENREWALVMKTPTAVKEEVQRRHWKTKQAPADSSEESTSNAMFRAVGYINGMKFDPSTKLEG